MIFLVDLPDHAECSNSDYSRDENRSITNLVVQLMSLTPSWIKWIVFGDSTIIHAISKWQCSMIVSLQPDTYDRGSDSASSCEKDIMGYVAFRLHVINKMSPNVCFGTSPAYLKEFQEHMLKQSKGNLLYCQLVLDLIESGNLVLKTPNFKVLPIDLHEALLLLLNLKFPRYVFIAILVRS